MAFTALGDIAVARIEELGGPVFGPQSLIPDWNDADVAPHMNWMVPNHFDPASGNMVGVFQSWLLKTKHHTILIDTCVGNDKDRSNTNPAWTNLKLPYLSDLRKAGYTPDKIDYVLQTHLHVDHVGWNTILKDGRWVPTFDNASYLIGGIEWDFYSKFEGRALRDPIEDSVRPIVEQGRANLIESTHRITNEVWLEPSPGHTPGHHHVRISSRGHEAIITGDLMHHPIQCAYPQWDVGFDNDGAKAKQVRLAFCESFADKDVLIFGTHFASPSCGKIARRGDSFRFVPQK